MPKTLALIHTSQVFLTVEPVIRDLCTEIMPEVRLINIVDDALLPDVMREKRIRPEVTRRMCLYVMAAESAGADAVLSLCSSLGPTIDVARAMVTIPVVKIDDAHTAEAARNYNRIGVMATVGTTLEPTVALVREKAAQAGRDIVVRDVLAAAAFEALMRGEKDTHDRMVLDAARELAPDVDVILFAQASMTRLAETTEQAAGRPVLTSPRRAIEYTKRVLDASGVPGS